MNDGVLYSLMADTILVIHFAFVVFVVFSFLLILIGLLARWSWVRNRNFRIAHLAAVGFVVLQRRHDRKIYRVGVVRRRECPLLAESSRWLTVNMHARA